MVVIQPCSALLVININQRRYFLVPPSQLNSCLQYNFNVEKCKCEINLFNNLTVSAEEAHNKCNVDHFSTQQAVDLCIGSALLTIEPECILQHDSVHISGHKSITTTLMSAYTSPGEFSERSQQDLVNDSSTASFNYSVLSNHSATQLTELATIQCTLEVIQATSDSNHNSKVSYSALIISAAAIIIVSCSMVFLKKAVPTYDAPQHEATPILPPRTPSRRNFIVQV
uniref:Uncharacterized protein n=1 Tax=Glossina palpalis gambiensis TaxID=67801 RepID=A0A1B0BTJ1_9MUSC